jgi:hypothetical protein
VSRQHCGFLIGKEPDPSVIPSDQLILQPFSISIFLSPPLLSQHLMAAIIRALQSASALDLLTSASNLEIQASTSKDTYDALFSYLQDASNPTTMRRWAGVALSRLLHASNQSWPGKTRRVRETTLHFLAVLVQSSNEELRVVAACLLRRIAGTPDELKTCFNSLEPSIGSEFPPIDDPNWILNLMDFLDGASGQGSSQR